MPATQPSITRIAARSCRLARYFFALLSFIALMSSHAPRAYAVTNTWTGQGASTNGNWSAATNWGGTAPDGGDNIIFAGTTGLTNTNNLAVNGIANVNINLLFATNAGAFVLNGTNATASALAALASVQVTNNYALTGNGTMDVGANVLTNSGVISGAGSLTKAGAGTLILSAANTYSGTTTTAA